MSARLSFMTKEIILSGVAVFAFVGAAIYVCEKRFQAQKRRSWEELSRLLPDRGQGWMDEADARAELAKRGVHVSEQCLRHILAQLEEEDLVASMRTVKNGHRAYQYCLIGAGIPPR